MLVVGVLAASPGAAQTFVLPSLTITPSTLTFGLVDIGLSSPSQRLTVLNSGNSDVALNAPPFTASTHFAVSATTCVPGPFLRKASCTIDVVFRPTAAGTLAGTLVVNSTGSDYPPVTLSGTGVAPPAPDISVNPTQLDFGLEQVGSTSQPRTVTVANAGPAPLVISRLVAQGDFGFTSDCGASALSNQASCRIDAVFAPVVPGLRVGSITLTSNDPDSPIVQVALGGEGVAPPAGVLTLVPTALFFPDTFVGERSVSQFATLINTGNAVATLGDITVSGAGFEVSHSCASLLPPGGSCIVTAVFAPTSVKAFGAEVRIVSDVPGSPSVLPLSGVGVAAPKGQLSAEPVALAFGDQVVRTQGGPRLLTVRNIGARAVTITSVGTTGDFSADGACPRLEPQATCALTVQFTPQAIGDRAGSVVILSDASNSRFTIPAAGRGIPAPAPRASLSASSMAFGNTLVGAVATLGLTLTNTGDLPLVLRTLSADGDLSVRSDCPATLIPNKGCTVSVGFQPRVAGSRPGTVTVSSNDPAGPAFIPVSGTGCRFALTGRGYGLSCTP